MAIVSSKEIVLDNNQRFHYTVHPFEMKNPLGEAVALLQEYEITSSSTVSEEPFYKLYKTKEGNWYEIENQNSKPDKIIRELKLRINSIESDLESVL
ncbi:MAG TPA: hypothetical protein VFT78_14270 [Hanamia sp.]|jgi:hypothetical protein|nr:hypothetical protein [Hanamia sp.]